MRASICSQPISIPGSTTTTLSNPISVTETKVAGPGKLSSCLVAKKVKRTLDDIRTYCRMVTALGRTLTIQRQVDALYPDVEKDNVSIQ